MENMGGAQGTEKSQKDVSKRVVSREWSRSGDAFLKDKKCGGS